MLWRHRTPLRAGLAAQTHLGHQAKNRRSLMAGTLIVALDLDTRGEAEALVDRLGEAVDFYKIGYQLIYGGDGLAFGKALIAAGKRIFFDLKLLDIDNTVEKGAAAIAQTGATMLTVHAYPQCMRAAQKATAGSGLTIPGISVF